MDIAALSMMMNQSQLKQQVDIAVMKKAIDQAQVQSEEMIKLMEGSVQPHLGQQIDMKG
ncbi:YjfB family protein [Gracilibacillus alcaliphilus]|uniref:YjfB family protein n=1 Tax=Gracilibacillus alcaliphilus TaxID=1401441 RepID=UPI0019564A76|nr:YjfB family protein [Gracilibacillus alcaliphilus]MBM7676000.1 hypothetical protein [Gracilibacillus alcaliphilus]